MAPRLSAIILAAGFSSRMGELKALLPLGGRTVLEQCLSLFQDCGIDDLVVVTGHRADEVSVIANRAGAIPIHNPDFADGMFSSIRTGVAHLAGRCEGFFLLPVDIPLVRRGTITLLTRSFAQRPAAILYPVFAGRRGHPPLLHRDLIDLIRAQPQPEGGLRTLLARAECEQPEHVREVHVADANIHIDLDTPEDYHAAHRLFARRDIPTMAECQAVIDHIHPIPDKGLAHGRRVAEVAVALCQAVNGNGTRLLDPELCRVSGWLHDIAKGHPCHEEEGARWLSELGFDRIAAIVAAHRDLDWTQSMAISEREIVHLADKLVRGSRLVPVDARFEEKLAYFAHDPQAVRAIRGRRAMARRLAVAVEHEAGQSLNSILTEEYGACAP